MKIGSISLRFAGYSLLTLLAAPLFAAGPREVRNSGTVAEQYLLAAVNQEREQRGLPLLHRDSNLAQAATRHALLMASRGAISHQFPGEPPLAERGFDAGVAFSIIEENVAEAPDAVRIHDLWMHSEYHREHMLNPFVNAVGISVIASGDELFAVEDFAKTIRSASLSDQEDAIGGLVARSGMTVVEDSQDIVEARRTCSMDSGFAGPRRPWFVMRFTSDSLTRLPEELQTRINSGRYREAAIGACRSSAHSYLSSYSIAVLLYP